MSDSIVNVQTGMRVSFSKGGSVGPKGDTGLTGPTGATGPAAVDATTSVKGKLQLSGDLSGTATTPTTKSRTTTVTVGPTGTTSDYVCDGTGDDIEINAAITQVFNAGGGRVLIRAGTYNIDNRIIPKNFVHIQGEGMFATKLAATNNLLASIIDNRAESSIATPTLGVILSDMELDGTNFPVDSVGHTKFAKGINSNVWTDCKMYNLYVHDTTATGIGVDGLLRTTIDHCVVINCGTQWTGAVLGFNGIGIASGGQVEESFVVSNCFVQGSGNNDYLVEADDVNTGTHANYLFTHNVSMKAGRAGFRNSGTPNVTFLNNHSFFSGQFDTNGTSNGIEITNASAHTPDNNIIQGNHVVGASVNGIKVEEPTVNCIIQGNIVRGNASEGITCLGSRIQVIGNQVFSNGSHGIHVGPPGGGSAHTSILIRENHVYNNALTVNNTNGIYIDGSHNTLTNVICQGNVLYDDQGTQTQRGIRLETPTGTYAGIVIRDNLCNSNKTFAVSLGATIGVSVKNNTGGTGANKTGANPETLQDLGTTSGTITLSNTIGNHIKVTANGNLTVHIDNGVIVGDTIVFIVTQDGTGSRTASWPANFKKAGGTLTLSTGAGAVDVISMRYDGTNWLETGRSLNVS